MSPDPSEGQSAPVPAWAVQVLQATIREFRYHADYLPMVAGETVRMEILRGSRSAGLLTVDHRVHAGPPERHDLRIVFQGIEGKHEERFTPHSLAQLKTYAPILMGRVCKYGMTLDPKWCEDCSFAERHLTGKFDPPRVGPGHG